MKNKYISILLYSLLTLYAFPAYSVNNFFFSHLGVEDGLSQLSVLSISQDSKGYLWFGTRNGLNRYDGYEFTIYKNEVNNPASLSDNYVRCMGEDAEQNMWIGTSNGLNRIDRQTGKITRLYPTLEDKGCPTNSISRILIHQDGTLYVFCSSYIFKCNDGKKLERIQTGEISSTISTVAQSAGGEIYVGTDKEGVFIFSSGWKLLQHLKPDDKVPEGSISVICPDKKAKGLVWIGTEAKGICLFDSEKQSVTRLDNSNTELSNNAIRTIVEMNDSILLLGTFGGLNVLHKQKHTIAPVKMNIAGKGGLSHYSIHSMLIDRNQTLWIGTYSAGVNYHTPYYTPVSYITTNEFAGIIGKGQEDKEGNMWFATEGAGLFCYALSTGRQELYPIKPIHEGNYETNIIKSILIQGDTILCSTHFGSVYSFSIRTKQYKLLHDFRYNDIYTLYADSQKRLWIPTNSEHNLVMAANGTTTNLFPSDHSLRPFKWVTTLLEIEPDRFIFGTLNDSIYLYDMKKQTTRSIGSELINKKNQERTGSTTAILQDAKGDIWISTTKNGLYRFDKEVRLVKHYQKKDGLSESHINTLSIDGKQCIWATTGSAVYRLDPQTDTFGEVNLADVPKQEFTLYAGNSLSEDGTLYFPGDKGILAFNPEKLSVNPNPPDVYITSLIINNKEEVISRMKDNTLTLNAVQNNITIKYTALNFIHSEKNRYSYALVGAERNWHHVGNRREAYYSNLAPGTYTLRVKAANNDGIWNPHEAVLHITINPPFYRTWWAYSLYIIIIACSIVRIIRYQHDKNERERESRYKQMEQEKMNELHEERMRMFTNFSHELRTPLTLIINPLNELLQHISFSPEVKGALQLMKKNTGRMLLLVNNLMDIQRYEAGKTILQKTRFNLSAFLNEMYQSFESVAANREISFTLQSKLPATYYVNFDEQEIEKVFFNLLSNAFKFTPAGGEVAIRIRSIRQQECETLPLFPSQSAAILIENRYLLVEVSDTGKGFTGKEAEKIFEPFYRAEEDVHKQVAGTGIGLSLTRSIVLQHNGCIWADSSETEGTTFLFLLPDTESQETAAEQTELPLTRELEINKKVNLLIEENEARNKPILLLVDDNQEVLEYVEKQLASEYTIRKAINGKEALRQIEHANPDFVVSDVMMPEMNGLELCRRIKENQNFCHIPVILLTAKSMISQIEEGLEAGADDYIVKPFHLSILKARIRNILNLREKMKNVYGETPLLKQLGVEEPESHDDFLPRYIEIVKANISNQDLDVSVIYEALGMSRANFYRKVKAVTGLSPIELIKNIRLEAGAKLLKESKLNISEIAQHIGFGSRSYFARSFKAVYGVSPTEYQEQAGTAIK